MHTNLLCTFTSKDGLAETLTCINKKYTIVYNYIYILQNSDEESNLFVTYNIDSGNTFGGILDDTILVHRKKHTNTLYTINALNILVRKHNNGVLDNNFEIDWNEYRNSIILTNNDDTRVISTNIYDIIDLTK